MLKEMIQTFEMEITFESVKNKTIYYNIRLNGCCYLAEFNVNKDKIKLNSLEKREYISKYTPIGDITLVDIVENSEELEEIIEKKWFVKLFKKWAVIK
jgi:hypothetical protein